MLQKCWNLTGIDGLIDRNDATPGYKLNLFEMDVLI
jgi:hypothetical protein